MKRASKCLTLIALVASTQLALTPSALAETSEPKRKKFVPPGFEMLLEPQTTQVDIYYGGSYVTSSLATFTPNNITLLDPDSITNKLPDISDPALILSELTKELDTNSAFVCLTANQTGCGKLEPDTVEVIFDENRFRVDVFISPELLNVRSAGIDPFLPPSDAGLSFLNVTSASLNGEQDSEDTYNFANSTTIAFKESRLVGISNYNDADDLVFDTLALQREFAGQLVQAGIFRANAGSLIFARESDFLGFSISSSLDTRQDLNLSSGNELRVFLNSRSRVDILKDDRLISTAIYDTGNQILDTSRLPGGAYEIVLRIRDNFGNTRDETRFYVKSNRLPPLDQPLYFLDFGEQVAREADKALPQKIGQDLYRAGFSRRINQSFAGELGIVSDSDQELLEAGLFQVGRGFDLRFNIAAGSNSARAASLLTNFRLGKTTLSANLRESRGNQNDLLGSELTQASLSASRTLGTGSINFNARYNKRATSLDRSYSLRYKFPTFTFHNQLVSSNVQVTHDNGDWQVLLGLRASIRNGSWQSSIFGQAYYEEDIENADRGLITNLSTTWQDGDRYLSDISVTARAVDERFDRTFESEVDLASQLGRLNVEAAYSEETSRTSYGVNLATTFIANRGTFKFGGKRQARSALVLDIKGEEQDAFFDVTVNQLVRDQVVIGRKSILPLAPFQSYEIDLIPRGSSLVDFENTTRQVTLYPGNVVTLTWEAQRILVAFGSIEDARGEPIANGLLEGVVGLATTDQFGIFQAEIKSTARTLEVRTREGRCTVILPDFDSQELVVTLGTLTCQ